MQHVPCATPAPAQPVFGFLGVTAIVLKLHKVSALGGFWLTQAAVVVVAEDIAMFLALFVAWQLAFTGLSLCVFNRRRR